MNGIHDLGGMDGFGAVEAEPSEPVFRHAWESRVFGTMSALVGAGTSNLHRFRHAIERMDPMHYLGSPYYEHWLTAAATLLVESGAIEHGELDAACGGRFPLSRPVHEAAAVAFAPSGTESAFAPGTAVRVLDEHPHGHTRRPRYVRGKRGVVVRVAGPFAVPDVAAHAGHKCRQFQYCVRFEAHELWGETAGAGDVVHVDLSEGYLERA